MIRTKKEKAEKMIKHGKVIDEERVHGKEPRRKSA
jgi:hypothetical protein